MSSFKPLEDEWDDHPHPKIEGPKRPTRHTRKSFTNPSYEKKTACLDVTLEVSK